MHILSLSLAPNTPHSLDLNRPHYNANFNDTPSLSDVLNVFVQLGG